MTPDFHPNREYRELLEDARAQLRVHPMLRRFCERLWIEDGRSGSVLQLRFHGPGAFTAGAALAVSSVRYRSHGGAEFRDFLSECETSWVRLYDEWLAKEEQAQP